jgi:hypothetical protein
MAENENNDQDQEGHELQRADEVVAKLPRDQLKSLFYLLNGKPDSRIKVFSRPIYLNKEDISELNDCVTRKLKTHRVDSQITTMSVGYKGSEIQEFGTWHEFEQHPWNEPECIEEIVIKWDFLVRLDQYELPQRHTLLVRISSDMKPGKFLQLIASGNSDDFEKIDVLTSPAFCRVDFINAQISKELINVVSDWYEGRKQPALIPDFYYWFKRKRQRIAEALHHSIPFMFSLLWMSFFYWMDSNIYNGDVDLRISAIWIFFGLYALNPMHKVGHMLASKVFGKLEKLEGSKVVFEFTSGDKKKIAEITDTNRQRGRKFLKASAWALFLNILAGLIAAYLFVNS